MEMSKRKVRMVGVGENENIDSWYSKFSARGGAEDELGVIA